MEGGGREGVEVKQGFSLLIMCRLWNEGLPTFSLLKAVKQYFSESFAQE